MNTKEALEFIKAKMGGDDSPERNELALAALSGSVTMLSLLGEYRWNEQAVEITLEVNKSAYNVDDLFTNFTVRKIFDEEMFYTAETGFVEVVTRKEFNQYKRGHTSTGKPKVATIHSRMPVIEFYPTPDEAYTLWLMAGILITNFDDLPAEIQLPAIWLAVMTAVKSDNPAYIQAVNFWGMSREAIEKTAFWTAFKGDQIEPDKYIGGTGEGTTYVDSTNIVGE